MLILSYHSKVMIYHYYNFYRHIMLAHGRQFHHRHLERTITTYCNNLFIFIGCLCTHCCRNGISHRSHTTACQEMPLLHHVIVAGPNLVLSYVCNIHTIIFHLFMEKQNSATLVSVTLVALAVLLSGLGVFDNIAKHAGAGTLVPITGFANAVVSPALDAKSEGLVLGVGAKIFTVAGPVLLYGIVSGAVWGVIYYAITLFG